MRFWFDSTSFLPSSFPQQHWMSKSFLVFLLLCRFVISDILCQNMPACINSVAGFKDMRGIYVLSSLQCSTTAALETCIHTGYWGASLERMRFGSLLQSWGVRWVSVHCTFAINTSYWPLALTCIDSNIMLELYSMLKRETWTCLYCIYFVCCHFLSFVCYF